MADILFFIVVICPLIFIYLSLEKDDYYYDRFGRRWKTKKDK